MAFLNQTTMSFPGLGSSSLASSLYTQKPQRAITPSSANSPYYYGGGGKMPTLPKITANTPPGWSLTPTAKSYPQLPGYTQPGLGASPSATPWTDPNPTTPFNQSLWDAQAALDWIRDEPIRKGQIDALNAQLQGRWGTDVIARARAAELAYGGTPMDPTGVGLQYSPFVNFKDWAAPSLFTYDPRNPKGDTVGQGLADALLSPDIVAAAANNPFSVLADVAHQQAQRNAAGIASSASRLGWSSELAGAAPGQIGQIQGANLYQADQARQQGANTFLGALQDLFSNYMDLYGQGAASLQSYNQDAVNRYIQLLLAQRLPPTTTPTPLTPEPQPPSGETPPEDWPDTTNVIGPANLPPAVQTGISVGYTGSGAGGFTGSTTMPAYVAPMTQVSSNNSPYYYGGGGRKPRKE